MLQQRSRLLLSAVLAATLTACGGDDESQPAQTASTSSSSTSGAAVAALLDHIPASSPYVMAGVDRLPESLAKQYWTMNETALSGAQSAIEEVLAKSGKRGVDGLARAALEEVSGKLNLEGFKSMGFRANGLNGFYAIDVFPVLRMELSDSDAYAATIARIEERAGESFERGEFQGQEYLNFVIAEEAQLVVAEREGYLVVSFLPLAQSENLLGRIFGIDKPVESIADTGALQQLNAEYSYTPYGSGYVNFKQLMATVLDSQQPSMQWLRTQMEIDQNLSPVCKSELMSLLDYFPRMVSGYTEMSADVMKALSVIELEEDLANRLTSTATDVNGLGTSRGGLFSFGMGMDIAKTKGVIQHYVTQLQDNPPACEHFAGSTEELAQSIQQPLPPFVGNLKGFAVNVDHVEMAMGMPGNVKANALFRIDNPEMLVNMGAAMLPQLAQLNLKPDGEVKPIPMEMLPMPIVQEPHVAMTDTAIALSVGPEMSASIPGLLDSEVHGSRPFMALQYTGEAFNMMADQMMASGGGMVSEDDVASIRAYGEIVDSLAIVMAFTQRGLEIHQDIELK